MKLILSFMKNIKWQITLGVVLLALSTATYGLHYFWFHDKHHIFIYLVGDVAFVFIEVLLVTLIIHGLLENKERNARLVKLNMVIGSFFSEVGTPLLTELAAADEDTAPFPEEAESLSPSEHFKAVRKILCDRKWKVNSERIKWEELRDFLSERRHFLLGLLQNQNLLEHEAFTDVLWAIFHLTEELEARRSFDGLPQSDKDHLRVDIERAYGQTACQWTAYMEHLRTAYPYLFSLALRTNPFNPDRSAVVKA